MDSEIGFEEKIRLQKFIGMIKMKQLKFLYIIKLVCLNKNIIYV